MKIIIIGAGISGLATYLFLQKLLPSSEKHEVIIYEAHSSHSTSPSSSSSSNTSSSPQEDPGNKTIGAGLGLAPNGLRVLRHLDPSIHMAVVKQGYPVNYFEMRNRLNWTLGRFLAKGGRKGEEEEKTVMSSRMGVWGCLRDAVAELEGEEKRVIVEGRCVREVKQVQGSWVCIFEDGGESENADLVVGADGIRSVLRKAIVSDAEAEPVYEGLIGVGGFVPTSLLPPSIAGSTVMTFGAQGFFGYGASSTSPSTSKSEQAKYDYYTGTSAPPVGKKAIWWSTYEIPTPPSNIKQIDKNDVRKQLQERHEYWKDPTIQAIVKEGDIQSLWPTYTTPKLSTWEKDGCVLIGDAAHALPSSSGQGVSQALEDAHALALLLSTYLARMSNAQSPSPPAEETVNSPRSTTHPSTETEAIRLATQTYTKMRKPRVEAILDAARKMGDMKRKKGVVEEWGLYLVLWILLHLPMKNGQSAFLNEYDVETEVEKTVKREDEMVERSS